MGDIIEPIKNIALCSYKVKNEKLLTIEPWIERNWVAYIQGKENFSEVQKQLIKQSPGKIFFIFYFYFLFFIFYFYIFYIFYILFFIFYFFFLFFLFSFYFLFSFFIFYFLFFIFSFYLGVYMSKFFTDKFCVELVNEMDKLKEEMPFSELNRKGINLLDIGFKTFFEKFQYFVTKMAKSIFIFLFYYINFFHYIYFYFIFLFFFHYFLFFYHENSSTTSLCPKYDLQTSICHKI